jgi:hypothetical protein
MTQKEEASFRAVYAQWPTARLARTVALEKKEYEPEAIVLMLEELKKRDIAEEGLSAIVAALPPPPAPKPERDTLFFPARLNRAQYLARFLLWLITVFGLAMLLEFGPWPIANLSIGIILIGLVYQIVGMDIPRLKNAGLSLWMLLLFVIPFGNLALLIMLFFARPDE